MARNTRSSASTIRKVPTAQWTHWSSWPTVCPFRSGRRGSWSRARAGSFRPMKSVIARVRSGSVGAVTNTHGMRELLLDDLMAHPLDAQRAGGVALLRRVRQLVVVAAVPRASQARGAEPIVVAHLPAGERAVRRGCGAGGAAGRHGVGARLPPAAGAGDDPRPQAPTSRSGCSCTSRSRTSSCSPRCRGGSELLDGMMGADLIGFQTQRRPRQLPAGRRASGST